MSDETKQGQGWPEAEPAPKKSRVGLWIFIAVSVVALGVLGLGCLATLILPNVVHELHQAYRDKAEADLEAIEAAAHNFHVDNGRWPVSIEELIAPGDDGYRYIDSTTIPEDPWKHAYRLEPSTGVEPPRIFTFGADNQPGGDGPDADISNRD